ncbi:transglutaminase-like domain-containing protein [Paenibacillus sp. CC-CFT747]|nr:transglutaminase-like domain-containing protein [Paenibacillus sp. CC-CFT747]
MVCGGGWGLLPATVSLIRLTLLAVLLTEWLPGRSRGIPRILQLLLILLLNVWFVGYTPVAAKTIGEWIYHNFLPFYPLAWFSLGAWFLYLAALWWVKSKVRIYVMIVLCLTAIAIRDSFSQVILWDEAALMILCGLFLLVIRHFAGLKEKNPAGWAYFSDYPVTITAPIVLLLTCTVGLGMLAPNVGNVLKDPYTLWKNWKGEAITVGGKGSPGVDLPLPKGSSTSGYSRNDRTLGGGFDFDYSEVMTVETTHRSYWRGETRALYNGKGWEKSQAEKQGAVQQELNQDSELRKDPRLPDSQAQTVEVKQTITLSDEESYPVLFGALSIAKVEALGEENAGFDRLRWSPKSQELRWAESRTGKTYPKTYTVISHMPVIDEAGLRTVPADLPNRSAMEEYLQLPNSLPDRVRQLAKEITKDAPTPYDKVKTLERYLQFNYRYTNQPREQKSESSDFVDRFLFETKEGYCDYYSTAMAVLTRSLGIPARWVKGYSTGSSPVDELEELRQNGGPDNLSLSTDGAGTYTVRNSDAHSWVEVYFSGWGWIPFEPTSGFAVPAVQLPNQPEVSPVPETDPAPVAPVPAEEAGGSFPVTTVLLILAFAAAAGIGVWFWFKRGLPVWSPATASRRA